MKSYTNWAWTHIHRVPSLTFVNTRYGGATNTVPLRYFCQREFFNMSKVGVRRFMGEIIGDLAFRNRYFDNPERTLKESGFDLTDLEIKSIMKLDPDDFTIEIEEIEAGDGVEAGFDIDVKTVRF